MKLKFSKVLFVLAALVMMAPACSPKKEIDPETFKKSYNQVVMNLARRNYERALHMADSCLALIDKDTTVYYIGLQNAVGMSALEVGDSIRSRKAFESALKMIEKRLRVIDTINYRDVFMKANTMGYLGQRDEAVAYIEQFEFPPHELRRFLGRQPAEFIKNFNYGPRTRKPGTPKMDPKTKSAFQSTEVAKPLPTSAKQQQKLEAKKEVPTNKKEVPTNAKQKMEAKKAGIEKK